MADFIIIVILVVAVGSAVAYMIKTKRSGVKCIGCPSSGVCSHNHGTTSACGCRCDAGTESDSHILYR